MAAPCGAIFRRTSLQFISTARLRAGSTLPKLRPHCIRKYTTPRSQSSILPSESETPTWQLMSAVCLERYPVISQDLVEIEEQYGNMLDTVELENSIYSDHELQVAQDKDKMLRRQSGALDDDDEGRELVSALDLEDQYIEEFNKFTPASRVSDTDDMQSIQRKLMDKLVLLVKCRVGDKSLWMMPQGTRQDGESMRQAADRILVSQCGMTEMWRARVFGNAPSACYKYVYPPDVQGENQYKGAKVFFYKVRLLTGDIQINSNIIEDYVWVTPSEMDKYLIPSYLATVRKFIVPINIPV